MQEAFLPPDRRASIGSDRPGRLHNELPKQSVIAPMDPIRILSIKSAFYTPILLTASRFLPDSGCPTNLVFRGEEDPGKMLRDDRLDFCQFAPSAAMADHAKGVAEPPIHIASINERDGFLLIGRRPEPEFRWQDLAGKTIVGANFAIQPEACLRFALHRQGLAPGAVTIVGGLPGMAAAAKAFADGTGDYVQLQDPLARNLVAQGKGCLVAMIGDAIGPIAFSSVATSQRMLRERPDTVRTFMKAYSRARHWIADTDAPGIAAAIEPWFQDVDPQVLHDAIAGYKALGTWTRKTAIARDAFETALDMFTLVPELTGVTQRYAYDACCNDAFAIEVDGD